MSVVRERAARRPLVAPPRRPPGPARRPTMAGVWPYLLIAPAVLGMLYLLVYPLARAVLISFQDFGLRQLILGDAHFVGFANYRTLLTDPRFWTVNFPRPAMAAVTTVAADALRVDAAFYRAGDLVGLIWEADDRHDHPLLAYETSSMHRDRASAAS